MVRGAGPFLRLSVCEPPAVSVGGAFLTVAHGADAGQRGARMPVFAQPFDHLRRGLELADLSTNALDTRYKRLAPSLDFRNLLLHGHTHAATPYEFKTALLRQKVSPDYTQINVGLDAWDLKPVSEEQIEELWLENLVNM